MWAVVCGIQVGCATTKSQQLNPSADLEGQFCSCPFDEPKEIEIMKLKKSWNAVLPGDRYASTLAEGASIPEELESEAMLAGVVDLPNRNSGSNQNGSDADGETKIEVTVTDSADFEGLVDSSRTGEQVDNDNNATANEASEVDQDGTEDTTDVSGEDDSPENGVEDAVDEKGKGDDSPNTDREKSKSKRSKNK